MTLCYHLSHKNFKGLTYNTDSIIFTEYNTILKKSIKGNQRIKTLGNGEVLCINEKLEQLLIRTSNNHLKIIDCNTGDLVYSMNNEFNFGNSGSIKINSTGEFLEEYSNGLERQLRITEKNNLFEYYVIHNPNIVSMAISSNGNIVVYGYGVGT